MPSSSFTRTDVRVVLLCWFGYSCAYVGRLNMGASILPMSEALHWSNATLGGFVSCFFGAYACGQLASGVLAHFFNPRWSFGLSIAGSALMNLLVPLFPTPGAMRALWFLNGCVQSLLWCSVVKAMSQRVSERAMPRSIVIISSTVSVGTAVAFGSAAVCASLRFWQGSFYLAAGLLALATALWFAFYRFPEEKPDGAPHAAAKAYPRATRYAEKDRGAGARVPVRRVVLLVALASLACAACGFLRDGLSTWAPKVLKDRFDISSSSSILLTLAMPLVGLLGAYLNKVHHERQPLILGMCARCFLAGTALVALALWALRLPSLPLTLAAFVGVTLAMIMVTNAITSMFCLEYRRIFDSALVAGIVDTFCYAGASLATWGLGLAADGGGWDLVFVLLAVAGAAGLLFSLAAKRPERRAAA